MRVRVAVVARVLRSFKTLSVLGDRPGMSMEKGHLWGQFVRPEMSWQERSRARFRSQCHPALSVNLTSFANATGNSTALV